MTETTARRPLLERLVRLGLITALIVLILVWPAALGVDHLFGKDVITVTELNPPDAVEFFRSEFDPSFVGGPADTPEQKAEKLREEIASIYGTTPVGPTRFLFVSDDDIIRPAEDKTIALLHKPGDVWRPQAKSLYFFARWTTLGAVGAVVVLFGLLTLLRRRRAATPAVATA